MEIIWLYLLQVLLELEPWLHSLRDCAWEREKSFGLQRSILVSVFTKYLCLFTAVSMTPPRYLSWVATRRFWTLLRSRSQFCDLGNGYVEEGPCICVLDKGCSKVDHSFIDIFWFNIKTVNSVSTPLSSKRDSFARPLSQEALLPVGMCCPQSEWAPKIA